MSKKTRRAEKPTLQIPPTLRNVRGAIVLAEQIAKLGGSVTVADDGAISVSVPEDKATEAQAAVVAFEASK